LVIQHLVLLLQLEVFILHQLLRLLLRLLLVLHLVVRHLAAQVAPVHHPVVHHTKIWQTHFLMKKSPLL